MGTNYYWLLKRHGLFTTYYVKGTGKITSDHTEARKFESKQAAENWKRSEFGGLLNDYKPVEHGTLDTTPIQPQDAPQQGLEI